MSSLPGTNQPIGALLPKGQPVLKDTPTPAAVATTPTPAPKPPIQAVLKDRASNPQVRPWAKVRLPAGAFDCERSIANWKAENKASAHMASAIRLWTAVLDGDVDTIRRMVPLLGSAMQPPRPVKRRSAAPDPLLESDSDQDSKSGSEMGDAIADVTAIDYGLNRRAIDNLASKLDASGYTVDELRRWYAEYWQVHDWRGKKGERPGLKEVQQLIARVRALQPLPPPAPGTTTPEPAPVATPALLDIGSDDEFEARLKEKYKKPARPALEGYAADRWKALMGEMQIANNRATYDEHFAPLRLVELRKRDGSPDEFVIVAPNAYARDWLERYAVPKLRPKLTYLYTGRNHAPDQQVRITIDLEDECST